MRRVFLALAFLLLASSPASASELDWKIYARVTHITPTASETVSRKTLEVHDSTGCGIGFEWYFSFWGGLEVDGMRTEQVLRFGTAELGRADVDILSVALNTHLLDNGTVDIYFGPVLSWVDWDEIVSPSGTRSELDDDLAPGVQAGLDVSITDTFAIVTGARYLKTNVQRGTISVDIDPVMVHAGVAVRF